MKETKTGATITINLDTELKNRIEALKKDNMQFRNLPLSNFLGFLVGLGVTEVEIDIKEKKNKQEARLKAAAQIPDRNKDLEMDILRLTSNQNLIMEALDGRKTLEEVRAEHGPAGEIKKRRAAGG